MAFRTTEVAVRLSSPDAPPECTCTVATITGCPDPSSKDERNGGEAGRLSALKLQLHQTLSHA